jgi:glyoxylase-like metal-dependent hydrolase (beta-lactamase superfamily II)
VIVATAAELVVHRHTGTAMPVNAYVVETKNGAVVVDSTLTVTDARAVRRRVVELSKPLLAVLITHAHPDHYGGAVEIVGGDDVPIVAAAGVNEVIRRDDVVKEQIIRPMFGDEWPRERAFPNTTLDDGGSISFDGVEFTLVDLGPGESPHDSAWVVRRDQPIVFAGDEAYEQMHCYLADGYWESWLQNIRRLQSELPEDAEYHFGHGDPKEGSIFDWQKGYITTFIGAIDAADWSRPERAQADVVEAMTRYLPSEDLRFLMELSIQPVAAQRGYIAPAAS